MGEGAPDLGEDSEPLWAKIKRLAGGTPEQQKEAVKILWERHSELPEESVEMLLVLADGKQDEKVRRAIADELAQRRDYPWGMYTGAMAVLSEDPKEEVRELVRKSLPQGWVLRSQIRGLRTLGLRVIVVLLAFLITSAVLSILALTRLPVRTGQPDYEFWVVLLSVGAGTLGSSASALISVVDRWSHGWELDHGAKWPLGSKHKDMFVARMIPWFCVRPLLGSVMGFLTYVGILGGYLVAVPGTAPADFSPHGLAFLALLAGLFAKTFLQKLRDAFKSFLGG